MAYCSLDIAIFTDIGSKFIIKITFIVPIAG